MCVCYIVYLTWLLILKLLCDYSFHILGGQRLPSVAFDFGCRRNAAEIFLGLLQLYTIATQYIAHGTNL